MFVYIDERSLAVHVNVIRTNFPEIVKSDEFRQKNLLHSRSTIEETYTLNTGTPLM